MKRIFNFQFSIFNLKPAGFTLPELLVVIGIIVTMLSFVSINLINSQRRSSLSSSVLLVLSDLKTQQLKAMVGDTEGRSYPDSYGVYLEANQYTLFNGNTYNSSSSSNLTIDFDPNITINNPNRAIIFNRLTGEVQNFSTSSAQIIIRDTSNSNQATIQLNALGTVIQNN